MMIDNVTAGLLGLAFSVIGYGGILLFYHFVWHSSPWSKHNGGRVAR